VPAWKTLAMPSLSKKPSFDFIWHHCPARNRDWLFVFDVELGPSGINRNNVTVKQIHSAAERNKLLGHLANCWTAIFADVSNRVDVWRQPTRQPTLLQITFALPLQIT
jgi:hypothetical protein